MAKLTKKERRDRKRRIWLIASPFIVLAAMFWPLIGIVPSNPVEPPDPVKIADYQAQYDVAANGELQAVEKITALFPNGRHGIFRFWDHVDPNNPEVRYLPTVTSITMDGHPEPADIYEMGDNRYTVAKIGDQDVLLTAGTHVYEIRYSIPGVISPASAGTVPTFISNVPPPPNATAQSVFWWNVVANGWRMPIANARVAITLPTAAIGIACSASTAPDKVEGPCQITGNGTPAVGLGAKTIPPFGGMTARVGMSPPAPPQTTVPWAWQLDPVLGRSDSDLTRVILLAVGAAVLGVGWTLLTRERKPGLPVLYAPPEGLGPVQTVFMAKETPGDHDIAATVFHLAQEGLLAIATKPRSWTATATEAMTPEAIAAADPASQALINALELGIPGAEFTASSSRSKGEILDTARKEIKKAVVKWAAGSGFVRLSLIGLLGRIVWVASLAAIVIGLTGRVGPTIITIVPLAFAVAGHRLMKAGTLRRRTRLGRDVWSRAGGFERMLATPSSELRFDFSARKEFFLPYLPYAVAFGVAKQWSEKYTDELDEEPPTPDWINYSSRRLSPATLMTSVGTFETTVRSTIGAYQAGSSGSSSGSGGGGSVGGGGGGGGGGSW